MGARSGSLGWVVIAGGISIGVASAMWGLLDSTFIATLIATDSWQAPADSIAATGRDYVLTTWKWLLLIVVFRVGLEAVIAARLSGATSWLPVATLLLVFTHILVVLYALVIPEMAQPLYELAMNDYNFALDALPGTETAVRFSYELAVGILPAVLLVIADGYYLSAPIRNDMLRRGI
ncbi:hypothetical protein [Haloplanus sp. C73]|uniref:hypothetical protein n=1 Tax=Haloplanus sp. C73 TaxID=3421641 RepID=UPI003EB86347